MNQNKINKAVSLYFAKLQRKIDGDKNVIYVNIFNSGVYLSTKTIKKASVKILEQLLKEKLLK